MEPRDVFDWALLVIIAAVVYVELFGIGISRERLRTILDTLLGLDLTVYLVLAGILGVAFVGYIAIYLPQKYSTSPRDRVR